MDKFGLSMFVEKPYRVVMQLYFVILGIMNVAWVIFLVPHMVAKGFSSFKAVYLASFCGLGSLLGRVTQGPIIHREWLNPLDLVILLIAINATIFLLDPLLLSFAVLGVTVFVGGLGHRQSSVSSSAWRHIRFQIPSG